MSEARQFGSVRTTAAASSLFDDRVIPAGTRGTVLETGPDGTCLVEVAFAPQTAGQDGDFAHAVVKAGQYEVITP